MATQVWRSNPGETAEQVTTAVGGATVKLVELTVDVGGFIAAGIPRSQIHDHVRLCVERELDVIQRNNPAVF